MGGNTIIMGTSQCQPIKAMLAVQPTRLHTFNTNFARDELGPLGPGARWSRSTGCTPRCACHGPPSTTPGSRRRELGDTVVQYVQGTGDPWGTMEIIDEFAAKTPNALPVVRFPSAGRYEGYRYVSERTDDVVAFFREHL